MPVLRLKVEGPSPQRAARLGGALGEVRLRGVDLLLVENDGDFVCPASYKLGAHANVRVTTVFDESESPFGNAGVYQELDALVVNKVDRASEAGFDEARFLRRLAGLHPNLVVFFTSCASGRGIEPWVDWVLRRRNVHFGGPARGASSRPLEHAFA